MHIQTLRAALSAAFFLTCTLAQAAGPVARDAIVDETLVQIREQYVFPDRLPAIERLVRKHQAAGDYRGAADDKAFAALLTSHLQQVTHDRHMSVRHQPKVREHRPAAWTSTPAKREKERRENYGLRKLEVLPGNVGYLDIGSFHDSSQIAGPTIAAAMGFLAHTDALIIDLRANRGGGQAMQLLASYFFDGVEPLMELRYRDGNVIHAQTQGFVPGPRYLDKPVFILTSGKTFSAGEAFALAMKDLKRATLVGATTRGGSNPVMLVPVQDDFLLSIPIGQSFSPATGRGWEGEGVEPHLAVDEKAALDIAYSGLLKQLHEASKDEAQREVLGKALAALPKG